MSKTIRRLLVAGLTLTLVGGVFTPILVQAAATDSTTAKTNDSTNSVHYQFDAVQAPYNIVTDVAGKTTNVPWYQGGASSTDVKQIFSSADILNADNSFKKNLIAASNGDIDGDKVVNRMISLATNGIDGDPNQSLVTALAAHSPLNISTAEFITYETNLDYAYAWLFKAAAQSALDIRTQADIQTEYDKLIVPKLHEIDTVGDRVNMPDRKGNFDYYVATFSNPDFNSAQDVLDNVVAMHLTESTPKELVNLNPQASADQERAMLNQPLKNFIVPQDGSDPDHPTYLADGQLSSTAYPTRFVFGETKSTTPSVTSQPVTVHYVDEQGKTLKPDKTLTGSLGDTYKAEALSIAGYKLVKTTGDESGKFTSDDQTVTYTYQKAAADTVVKDSVIYGLKRINLYSSPTFAKKAVKATYAKKSRMNRPMFKVIGTAASKNGLKRYRVKDLNGQGTTGYVTANAGYVAPLYYATKHNKVTVINPKGLNAYAKQNLTKKQSHYKQGQVLKVKKLVTHNLTTRFQLTNGKYVSTNKNLVLAGEYSLPKQVQAKTGINRYGTANLTKKNRHIAKGTTLKITGWAYSNAHNFSKGDTLRYKVAGGYVTANARLVDTIR